jgi:hypothetical protein
MDDRLLKIQCLTRQMVRLLVQEFGPCHAADLLESAAGKSGSLVTHW